MAFVKQTIKTGLEKISIIAELLVWQKKKIIPREEPRFRLIKTQFTEITQKAISISIDDHADLRVELLQLIGEIKECLKICKIESNEIIEYLKFFTDNTPCFLSMEFISVAQMNRECEHEKSYWFEFLDKIQRFNLTVHFF